MNLFLYLRPEGVYSKSLSIILSVAIWKKYMTQ